MKRLRLILAALLICLMLLTACNKAEPEVTEPPATEAEETGYDLTSPKTASWFDDAVFVGDSVTLKLSYFCLGDIGYLGSAVFYCAGSLGYTNALWDLDDPNAVHPYYRGDVHLTEECSLLTGKNNVFIMLGMNDIGMYGVDDSIESCKQLVKRIQAKTPKANLYFQSVTPMIEEAQSEDFNNDLVREFNSKLKAYCEEEGFRYLDVCSAMEDEDGNLPYEYCSDPDAMGLHFTDEACNIWVDYLKENA